MINLPASGPFPRLRGKVGMGACLISAMIGAVLAQAALTATPSDTSSASLLRQAQSHLASGHPDRAIQLYDQVESSGESVEAELGLVRARLQLGEMRAATAFANLVAGEHADSSAASTLLAYIEDRLGYTEKALKRLADARSKWPTDPVVLAASVNVLLDHGAEAQARALLGDRDAAVADAWPPPYSEPIGISAVGPQVQVANGFVVDDGATVITHATVIAKSPRKIVIRNGLGLVRTARVKDSRTLAPGVVALRLASPFPAAASLNRDDVADASKARFCFVLGFARADAARFSYPVVVPGMVFRASTGNEGLMQVTSMLAANQIGGPMFDDQGRLLGMAIGNQAVTAAAGYAVKDLGAGNFVLRLDGLRTQAAPAAAGGKTPPKPAIEELYEKLAPAVVQVFVER